MKPGYTPSEEEKKLTDEHAHILAGINAAQNELIELGVTKKRVQSEKDEIEKEISSLTEKKEEIEKELQVLEVKRKNNLADHEVFQKTIANKETALRAGLPDATKIIADLEATKAPIKNEIDRLSQEREQVRSEIAELESTHSEKISKIEELMEDIALLNKNKSATELGLEKKLAEVEQLDAKKVECKALISNAETSTEIVTANGKKIQDQEAHLADLRTNIAKEETHLALAKSELVKMADNTNAKIKTLSILETRVDAKIEIFKAYKEKFTVDELASMKINPELNR